MADQPVNSTTTDTSNEEPDTETYRAAVPDAKVGATSARRTAKSVLPHLGHIAVTRYFETMNAGSYADTAALFTTDGEMRAPFEAPVKRPNIAAYLAKEASGMALHPRQAEPLENCPADDPISEYDIKVMGYVQTPLFGINVAWLFAVEEDAIRAVRIKLLASPQELLKLRR